MKSEPEFRRQVLERRRALPQAEAKALSAVASERFLQALGTLPVPVNLQGLRVAAYRSLSDELALDPLLPPLQDAGARLYFPRIRDSKAGLMEMALQGERWVRGPYGIDEPSAEAPAIDVARLDWVLVPGVVFGESGERIGMGKGFYDRYLSGSSHALRIALAFDFQVFPGLPQNPWDEPVDWIITDRREVRTARFDRYFAARGVV